MAGFRIVVFREEDTRVSSIGFAPTGMAERQVHTMAARNHRIDTAFNETTPNDNAIRAIGESVVIIDGCVFNAESFVSKGKHEDFPGSAFRLLKDAQCKTNLNAFRGVFAGVVFDSDNRFWRGFTNHFGTHTLYYYHDKTVFIAATHIHYITDALKDLGIGYSLDEDGACYMLAFNSMFESTTLIQGIHRLKGGCYFDLDTDRWVLNVETYYAADNATECKLSYRDILEQAGLLFRHAVFMGIERDRQAGKTSVFNLSDGLDCRATTFVAEDLGCKDKLIVNYSQSGSTQYSLPREIMAELSGTLFQMPLDGGHYLMRHLDHWFENIGGIIAYDPQGSPLFDILRVINWSKHGLHHNGYFGGEIFGCDLHGNTHTPPDVPKVKLAGLKGRIDPLMREIVKQYPNEELFQLMSEGTNWNSKTPILHRAATCSDSPFLDPDFVNFLLSVPLHFKTRNNMRIDFLCTCCPKAARTPYRKTRISLAKTKKLIDHNAFALTLIQNGVSCKKRLARMIPGHGDYGMDPAERWYKENQTLRHWMDETYRTHIADLSPWPEIRHFAEETFVLSNSRKGIQYKLNVLSLLYAVKRFFA